MTGCMSALIFNLLTCNMCNNSVALQYSSPHWWWYNYWCFNMIIFMSHTKLNMLHYSFIQKLHKQPTLTWQAHACVCVGSGYTDLSASWEKTEGYFWQFDWFLSYRVIRLYLERRLLCQWKAAVCCLAWWRVEDRQVQHFKHLKTGWRS